MSSTLQLSIEELKSSYEKEKAKLDEMVPARHEPSPQGMNSGQLFEVKACEKLSPVLDRQLFNNILYYIPLGFKLKKENTPTVHLLTICFNINRNPEKRIEVFVDGSC